MSPGRSWSSRALTIGAANSMKFYEQQKATGTEFPLLNMHMRQQITITAVDTKARTVSVDKPLEYDVPVTSVSDGSAQGRQRLLPRLPSVGFPLHRQHVPQPAALHVPVVGIGECGCRQRLRLRAITDWAHNEQRDFTGGHGVDATKTDASQSLFLKSLN